MKQTSIFCFAVRLLFFLYKIVHSKIGRTDISRLNFTSFAKKKIEK